MSGRPAKIRQRDLKQTLLAAQKAGAKEVRVQFDDGTKIVIPLVPDEKTKDERSRPGSIADAIRRDLEANGSY